MGLDVEGFSSPRPYPSKPCRAYHIRLYMRYYKIIYFTLTFLHYELLIKSCSLHSFLKLLLTFFLVVDCS